MTGINNYEMGEALRAKTVDVKRKIKKYKEVKQAEKNRVVKRPKM